MSPILVFSLIASFHSEYNWPGKCQRSVEKHIKNHEIKMEVFVQFEQEQEHSSTRKMSLDQSILSVFYVATKFYLMQSSLNSI